jgi:acyl dehydratase
VKELTLATHGASVGEEVGVSNWLVVDPPRIDAFTSCTGDHEWIRVDVERAKRESPFRDPLAHGYRRHPQGRRRWLELWPRQGSLPCSTPAGAQVRLGVVLVSVSRGQTDRSS